MFETPDGRDLAHSLLKDGFVELTEKNAQLYALGIHPDVPRDTPGPQRADVDRAAREKAASVAGQIFAGPGTLLTENIAGGVVRRTTPVNPKDVGDLDLRPAGADRDAQQADTGLAGLLRERIAALRDGHPLVDVLGGIHERLMELDRSGRQLPIEGDPKAAPIDMSQIELNTD
jgi:hypothetical protein